jgi:CO/xanthine dehydrogenase FAD-binding subunit
MKIYSVPFVVYATAYVKANSIEEAVEKADALKDQELLANGNEFWHKEIDHPDLPDVTLSPAMTIGDMDEVGIELQFEE